MTINHKDQNDIIDFELIKSFEIEEIFNNRPINRLKNDLKVENKTNKLNNLKREIENIENCKLKINASQIVFNDGKSIKIKFNIFYTWPCNISCHYYF